MNAEAGRSQQMDNRIKETRRRCVVECPKNLLRPLPATGHHRRQFHVDKEQDIAGTTVADDMLKVSGVYVVS